MDLITGKYRLYWIRTDGTYSGQEYGSSRLLVLPPTYRTGNVASHIYPTTLPNPLVCRFGNSCPSEHYSAGASYALLELILRFVSVSTYQTQLGLSILLVPSSEQVLK